MERNGQADVAAEIWHWIGQTRLNPLGNFLAHGIPWCGKERIFGDGAMVVPPSAYPKEWKNDGVAFLNDRTNGFVIMLGPNQTGKSMIATAKTGLHIVPCDPEWPVFKHNGVVCPEWHGPKTWILASYSWDNVKTLWNRVQDLFPRHELRNYCRDWGAIDGERGPRKNLAFGDGKPKECELACGSRLIMYCYTQLQMHWEGFTSDGQTADEQEPEEKWVGWARSTRTRGDYCPSIHALTGHVIDDRPDTGAAGWFKREVWDGVNTRGRTVGRYHLSIECVPDSITSAKKKAELWEEWVNPAVVRTEKQKRAAVARYWGGWEEGSGRVFEEFNRALHVINPIWKNKPAPESWTKWRVMDYGDNGVTCVLWIAVSPKGWSVVYNVLYERGLLVAQTAQRVVEMSYNERRVVAEDENEITGERFKVYEEIYKQENFYGTLLDSRSAASDKQGQSLIQLFARHGLDMREACGQRNEQQVPRLKDKLRIDYSVPHPFRKNSDGTPFMGCPGIFFFDGLCDPVVSEIEGLQKDEYDHRKFNKKDPHHAVDALKYWASDSPAYYGDWNETKQESEEQRRGTPFTNY